MKEELYELIDVPNIDDMERQIREDLQDNKSKITNFRNGSVIKSITMIFLKCVMKLYELILDVVPQVFLKYSTGDWLDEKAKEYSTERKDAQKCEGYVTAMRHELDEMPVIIPEGLVIRTEIDSDGKELRYIVKEKVIMGKTELKVKIPVTAETTGAIYNVPASMIKFPVQHVPGVDGFTNEQDWITKEGTDREDDDSLRERCENSWDELAMNPTTPAYISSIKKVNGVLDVGVDDLHPRGQGTIDITVIGTAGVPTEALLQEVRKVVNKVKGPYDNVLVKAPEVVYKNINVVVYIENIYGDEERIKKEVESRIRKLFALSKEKPKNILYRAVITRELMEIKNVTNIKIAVPEEDVVLKKNQIILLGEITVNLIREEA